MNVFFETYGCSLNYADSLLMIGLLKNAGYSIVDNEKCADIIVINTCTVKQTTERKIIKRIKSLKNKKLVITGCLVQVNPDLFNEHSLIGCEAVHSIVDACESLIKDVKRKRVQKLNLVPLRKNKVIEIIPISQGCLGDCNYCQTKFARGRLYSYDEKDIIRHAKKALEHGAKELWLTSQDTGCYGFDKNTNLAMLLKKLIELPYDFRIRIGMMNPNNLKIIINDLLKVFKSKKIFKFLHIPIQSGSDKVLKSMNRQYSIKEFKLFVKKIRKEFYDINISTDIICGYPSETEKDWQESIELIKWLKPGVLNISRFWARPGTKAEKLKQLHGRETKKRSRELTAMFQKLALNENKKYKNKTVNVLIDEENIGRTSNYKQVVIKNKVKLGKQYKIIIDQITWHDLRGNLA